MTQVSLSSPGRAGSKAAPVHGAHGAHGAQDRLLPELLASPLPNPSHSLHTSTVLVAAGHRQPLS